MKPTAEDVEEKPLGGNPRGPEERVGQVIKEKWRIDALLGAGGMAAVYAATHRNGNRVAIKLLHPQYVADQTLRQRFLREGYLANLIEHPAVVRVLDDDDTGDGGVFLVMELLEGETLAQRLRREGRLPEAEVLRLGYEALDVLGAAHAKGIVHRDIKPDNLFFTREGTLKVLDFGIARLREWSESGEVDQTRAGMLLGTPAYMAPEQALQHADKIDGQTDLWALGATLFRLLTGKRVREGATFNEQLFAAASQPAPPLKSVMPEVSPPLAAIVDRALAFAKAARWPNAAAMQAAIAPLLAAEAAGRPLAGAPNLGPTRPLPALSGPTEISGPPRAMMVPDPRPPSISALPTLRTAARMDRSPDPASPPPQPAPGRKRRGAGPMLATLVLLVLISAGLGLAWMRLRPGLPEPRLTEGTRSTPSEISPISPERAPPSGGPGPASVDPPAEVAPPEERASEEKASEASAGVDAVWDRRELRRRRRLGPADKPEGIQRRPPSSARRKRASPPPNRRAGKPATELGQDDDLFGRRH